MKIIDDAGIGFGVCISENDKVLGIITDGDFRRAILNGIKLGENITNIINREYYSVNKETLNSEIENVFRKGKIRHIPVIDNKYLIDIITSEDNNVYNTNYLKQSLDNPVVIMAGGKGKRLDPFTRILPKPLIPLNKEPIIVRIINQFIRYGMIDFYITLNDKAKMIKAYFNDFNLSYNINFIDEKKPLGTAGSLKELEEKFEIPIFVSNCDIIINADYKEIMDFHKEREYALTIVGSMKHHIVPYGVCQIRNGGDLIKLSEKPEYDFLINTGFYVIDPKLLSLIPPKKYFDMTDLISHARRSGFKVGVFPISEKSWIDIGQWSEYKKVINKSKL